jgi:ankyrin repeat protein
MAYVGRTERLCQAIVSNNVEAVKAFLAEDGTNPDRRDYTGRTPLQLACMSSTPEIVQCLVDRGARMIPRMADGKTALHLAAARGDIDIIRILLTKSNQNEEEEEKKKDAEKKNEKQEDGNIDAMSIDGDEAKDDMSLTSESYVKVENEDKDTEMTTYDTLEDNELEPDVYDINVVAWDSRTSPLHLAILHGHIEAVKELVTSFGADVLLPIKILNDYSKKPEAAILTLVLALSLPSDKAREMSKTLLELGASPAQADLAQKTPLYYLAHSSESELFDVYLQHDEPAVKRAINHLAVMGSHWSPEFSSTLMISLTAKNSPVAAKLLDAGAKPEVTITDFVKALKAQRGTNKLHDNVKEEFKSSIDQPILHAVESDLPLVAIDLLNRGVNVNTERKQRYSAKGETVLDITRGVLKSIREYLASTGFSEPTPDPYAITFDKDDASYLADFVPGSYKMFIANVQLRSARKKAHDAAERFKRAQIVPADPPGTAEKKQAISELSHEYEKLEAELLARGAKTFEELYPVYQSAQAVIPQVLPETKKPKKNVFKVRFNFNLVGMSDACREGYLELCVFPSIGGRRISC